MTSPDVPRVDGDAPRSVDVDDDAAPSGRQPNYLIRRGIAVGGVVGAVAIGAVVVGSLIGGDDDATTGGGADADWNTIVLLDERSGIVIVADEVGEEQARFESGLTSPTDALVSATTLFATSADEATIVDLTDESAQTIELDVGDNGVIMPSGTALTMLTATQNAGRSVMAHGPSGEVLDTESFAPIAGARYDFATTIATPSGRDVLVTDSGNFQSVLFSFDRDEPSFFPGRALAVGDELVVTTQNVGSEASITVFDHDGASVTDARTPPIRAGMISGGSVIVVTVEGEVIELTASNGATSTLDTLAVGIVQTGHVSPAGDRLIVVGDAGSVILDGAGDVVATIPDLAPLDEGIDELAPRTSSCVAFVDEADAGLVIVSLTDGSIVAEAQAETPKLSTVDGCTVVATDGSGLSVISGDGVSQQVADGELTALSPDGTSAVTRSDGGRLQLTDLSRPPSERVTSESSPGSTSPPDAGDSSIIDLGPASRLVLFTQR